MLLASEWVINWSGSIWYQGTSSMYVNSLNYSLHMFCHWTSGRRTKSRQTLTTLSSGALSKRHRIHTVRLTHHSEVMGNFKWKTELVERSHVDVWKTTEQCVPPPLCHFCPVPWFWGDAWRLLTTSNGSDSWLSTQPWENRVSRSRRSRRHVWLRCKYWPVWPNVNLVIGTVQRVFSPTVLWLVLP